MAQWLWRLQSDTLGSSPAVAVFSLFSFLPEQVEFQKNFHRPTVDGYSYFFVIGGDNHLKYIQAIDGADRYSKMANSSPKGDRKEEVFIEVRIF